MSFNPCAGREFALQNQFERRLGNILTQGTTGECIFVHDAYCMQTRSEPKLVPAKPSVPPHVPVRSRRPGSSARPGPLRARDSRELRRACTGTPFSGSASPGRTDSDHLYEVALNLYTSWCTKSRSADPTIGRAFDNPVQELEAAGAVALEVFAMKTTSLRLPALALASFFFASALSTSADPRAQEDELPKADRIIDAYVEATGGTAAYAKLLTRVENVTIEIAGAGMTFSMTAYYARPDKAVLPDRRGGPLERSNREPTTASLGNLRP